MIPEITGLMGAIKGSTELAKVFIDLRDAAKIAAAVGDMQSKLLDTQVQAMGLIQKFGELEARNRELEFELEDAKRWDAERATFELRTIAQGVFAYVSREDDGSNYAESVKLCANCFDSGSRSILQQGRGEMRRISLVCHRCSKELSLFSYSQRPAALPSAQ